MKTFFLILASALASIATATSAKSLEITVTGVRNDKGNILVMAKIPGVEAPVYAMSPAAEGDVAVTLNGIDADAVEVSLFHDEDGDYRMKTGERGPEEGYAARKCKLPGQQSTARMQLYYPAQENR